MLALTEIVDGGDADFAGFEPSKALAIGRDGDLANGTSAVEAGEDFVKARRGWRERSLRGGGAQSERGRKIRRPQRGPERAPQAGGCDGTGA